MKTIQIIFIATGAGFFAFIIAYKNIPLALGLIVYWIVFLNLKLLNEKR